MRCPADSLVVAINRSRFGLKDASGHGIEALECWKAVDTSTVLSENSCPRFSY